MRARRMVVAAAVLLSAVAANVWADAISDHLEKALELTKAKKYLQAKTEIEKALALVTPKAKAQIPKPSVKNGTYTNYEHSFRVTRPQKDWQVILMKTKDPGGAAVYVLCQIMYTKEGVGTDDKVMFQVRDLKEFLGSRYRDFQGQEMETVKSWGRRMVTTLKKLEDVQVRDQKEITVSGCRAVRTDYTARRGLETMHCFTVDILRGHMLFTGMFVGTAKNTKAVTPVFKQILDSIDLSPVKIPEK